MAIKSGWVRALRHAGLRRPPPARIGFLDCPTAHDVVDRHGFAIAGWAWLGGDHPRIAALEAWSGPTLLGETRVLSHRPDVCAALTIDSAACTGFHFVAHHPSAARGATFAVAIRARLDDGTRTDPLCVGEIRSFGFDDPPLRPPTADGASVDDIRQRASATDGFPLPPDHLQIRQVGGVWGRSFYQEGRLLLSNLEAAFRDAGKPLAAAEAILDFGCGCGRVLASFADLPHRGELWGCDIDGQAIAWIEANLGFLARFRKNAALPPTGFERGQFDAIYAVSVFTHLPEEMQFAWLTELRRIIRPGGVLVASVHGGQHWSEADPALRIEVAMRGFAYRMPQATPGLPDFYHLAFHSEAYVRAKWTRFFDLAAYRERLIHGAHDVVVLRRTE
jgi:SAM-dependent methyltransferase